MIWNKREQLYGNTMVIISYICRAKHHPTGTGPNATHYINAAL